MDYGLIERINLLPRAQAISVGDSVFSEEQRRLIAEAYKSLLGKDIPNCSCRHRYSDAIEEICLTLKIKNTMNCKYQLLAGVIIWLGTDCYNNHNLTDEVAEEYLKRFPEAREKEFQKWPEENKEPQPEPEPKPEPKDGEGQTEGEGNDGATEGETQTGEEPKEGQQEKKPKGKKG